MTFKYIPVSNFNISIPNFFLFYVTYSYVQILWKSGITVTKIQFALNKPVQCTNMLLSIL